MSDTSTPRSLYESACQRIQWALHELESAEADKVRAMQMMASNEAVAPSQREAPSGLARMRTLGDCVRMLKEQDPQCRVSRQAILTMINQGIIGCVYSGKMRLINFDDLCAAITKPAPVVVQTQPEPEPLPVIKRSRAPVARGIRPIPE